MPIHDWTRVDAGVFHAFHLGWIVHLSESLNDLLPPGLYPITERNMKEGLRRTLAIRSDSDHSPVANIEMFSTGNQIGVPSFREFVEKVVEAIQAKIHVVVIDLFPEGYFDFRGLGKTIMKELGMSLCEEQRADRPLYQMSFCAEPEITAYIEPLKIGDVFPDLPLFVGPNRYVSLPLESTYTTAFRGMPAYFRKILEE